MKKLFLSHYNKDAHEMSILAEELRFRGVRPWVDKQGGFTVADDSALEAERAVREDCFGLLLYASAQTFNRPFITHHEVLPALAKKAQDSGYLVFAVPRKLSFSALKSKSCRVYNHDLSKYHTHPLPENSELNAGLAKVANEVVRKMLASAPNLDGNELTIQFSTIEEAPTSATEQLFIDGRSAYLHGADSSVFDRLVQAMRETKKEIAARFGRPVLRVEGFKHLSAAFTFGRVFQPFDLVIRQTPEQYWASNSPFTRRNELSETLEVYEGAKILAVQISSRYKELSSDVDNALASVGSFNRLVLRPEDALEVDNKLCCALADQAYRAIEKATIQTRSDEVHIFAAAPQALMMMIGQKFAGMPRTYVYDFCDGKYGAPKPTPAGPL